MHVAHPRQTVLSDPTIALTPPGDVYSYVPPHRLSDEIVESSFRHASLDFWA
jgi:hypothetical protein